MTSRTKIDNAEIDKQILLDHALMNAYIEKHRLPAKAMLTQPSLTEDYLPALLGGRIIPSTPQTNAKCSVMMKVGPLNRLRDEVFNKELAHYPPEKVLTCTGKRWDESLERRVSMAADGEVPWEPVERNGRWLISLIAHFTINDVWDFCGDITNHRRETYSDFTLLMRNYNAGNGGVCGVLVHEGKTGSTGCNNRYGCFVCTRVGSDKSLEAMTTLEEYTYLTPLVHLRNWIAYSATVPEYRNYLSKELDDLGRIAISPNTMSPKWITLTLAYVLSIQEDELEWAAKNNTKPRFVMLDDEQLMYLTLMHLRYGHLKPLTAYAIKRAVERGERWYPPEESPAPRQEPILAGGLKLPFADADYHTNPWFGLRSVLHAFTETETTVVKKSKGEMREYWDIPTSDGGVEFDAEGLSLWLTFERDRCIDKFHNDDTRPGLAFSTLMGYGFIHLSKGSHSEWDRMFRVANQIHALGLNPIIDDPIALVERLSDGTERYAEGNQFALF